MTRAFLIDITHLVTTNILAMSTTPRQMNYAAAVTQAQVSSTVVKAIAQITAPDWHTRDVTWDEEFSLYGSLDVQTSQRVSTNQNIQTDLSRRTAAPGEFSEISPEHVRIVANTLFIGSYSLATVDTVYGSMEQSLMCHRRTLLLLQVI